MILASRVLETRDSIRTQVSKARVHVLLFIQIMISLMHIEKSILWSNSMTLALTQGSPILRFLTLV